MTRELSDDARSFIVHALSEEAPPSPVHRGRLRRAVIARAAAAGGGAAVLVGTSVAKAGAKSLLLAALGSAGVGLGAGVVFAGAAHFAFAPPAAPEAAASAVWQAPAVPHVAAPVAALPRAVSVDGASAEAPSVPEPAVMPPPRGSLASAAPATSAAPGPALRAELDLLAEVQGALRDHQAARALELIARYDARFPRGSLVNERLAAEVFAACQIGEPARAKRVAALFLQADSTSALAVRVRSACADAAVDGR
jgi:hypothetical protein